MTAKEEAKGVSAVTHCGIGVEGYRNFMKFGAKITENRAKTVPKRSQNEARTPKGAQLGPGSRFGPNFNQIWSYFGSVFGSISELFGDCFSETFSASIWSGFGMDLELILVTFWCPEALAGRKVDFSKTIEFLK